MAILNTAHLTAKIPTTVAGETTQVSLDSNVLKTSVLDNEITIVKSFEKDWALPGETIKITTTITNNSEINIEGITFKDNLSTNATFKAGSLKIGSMTYEDFDPVSGFVMPVTLGGGGVSFDVSYDVIINTLIDNYTLTDETEITFDVETKTFSLQSNLASVKVLENNVALLKSADNIACKSKDTLHYKIEIINDGELKNTELFFSDPLPEDVTFVEGSVTINSESQPNLNPSTGFALPDLDANQTITVEFSVTVN